MSSVVDRIWAYDASLWTGSGEDRWLGWLDVVGRVRPRIPELNAFAEAASEQFDDFVLLGMGGSSLAPEVLRRAFAVESFHVLDTTHPAAIRRLESSLDLERTLFIASSKSGSTIETRSHLEYFWDRTGGRGAQFAAITDPGSELEQLAQERGFRATFPGEPEIGGRYSALSLFGMVPASLMGVALERFLERAAEMMEALLLQEGNPGFELGLQLGEGWQSGRDKVCIDSHPSDFGLWAEQLLAESTGKQGKGLVPAPGEAPEGPDRQRGEVRLPDPYELGQEWLRWEFATAVAGHVLGINPFDQPDVQAAKDKTNEVLAAGEPDVAPRGSLDELLAGVSDGDYVCIQAFIDPAREGELAPLTARAHETGCVVTSGLGPRYLHSTGQLHKGGPEHRSLHPGRRRDWRGAGDSRARLRLRAPDPLAGRRRPRGARRAGQARCANPTGGNLMQLGMVGLGRMGSGMTKRLERDGHEVKTFDPKVTSTAKTLRALAKQLDAPRHVWMMVPSGEITEDTFQKLLGILEPGDTIIDGGNSNFRDSQRRYKEARKRKISFADVGVSGGIWGLEAGFCLMAGGDKAPLKRLAPIFGSLAPENGWAHVGPSGAGHFTKMVHNGIEYGLMQAYAEGFELMYHSEFELDLSEVAGIWRYGSVVRSWLLELLCAAMEQHGDHLDDIAPYVEDSGEGRWTINEAIHANVPVPAITAALFARFASRREIDFSAKVQAALRNQFGGHAVKAAKAAKARP